MHGMGNKSAYTKDIQLKSDLVCSVTFIDNEVIEEYTFIEQLLWLNFHLLWKNFLCKVKWQIIHPAASSG